MSPSPQVAFSILASGAFTTFAPLDFSVEIKANLPSDFEWVWYWSDASPTETAFPPDAFTNHLFKEPRKYVVTLKLRSPASNSILGTAVKDIVIDDLNALKKMQTLRLALLNIYLRGSERPKDVVIIAPLYMQRNIFSTKWQTKVGNTTTTHSIEGEVSEDERTLLSATWVADTFEPGTQGTLFVGHEKLAVKNVPLDNRSLSVFSGKLERDKVKSNVLYEYSSANEGNRIVDWDNPRASPRFECEFK